MVCMNCGKARNFTLDGVGRKKPGDGGEWRLRLKEAINSRRVYFKYIATLEQVEKIWQRKTNRPVYPPVKARGSDVFWLQKM